MSNTLLDSLWARVSANIGDRINQAQELLTKALAANTESKAARDAAAVSATEAAEHADRAEQATDVAGLRNEVTQQIADLVDGAPEDLDTIREVSEYAQANRGITDQLNAAIGNKANKSHTHTTSHISDYPGHVVFIGSDSYGKIPVREPDSDNLRTGSSPTEPYHVTSKKYVDSEVAKKANSTHTHTQAQVSGLSTALNNKADKTHTHTASQVDGLEAALARLSNIRAWFRGEGPPPASIPGAQVGDWWLDTTTKELHEITGV